MDAFETQYVLRRVRPGRRDAAQLSKALAIYHANTPYLEATATNEVQYWADRYNTSFSDQLLLFILEIGGEVVGFSECVYFTSAEIVVLDYLTVDDSHKTIGTFLIFYEQIKAYFSKIGVRYNYIVAELLQDSDANFTDSSEFWRTLMSLEGFRVIDAHYEQLQLGRTKFDTQLPGRLMIAVEEGTESIRTETYLMIVNTIFIDHFVRWYEPFFSPEQNTAYRTTAREKIENIRQRLNSRERLTLSSVAPISLPSGLIRGRRPDATRFIAIESISYVILLIVLLLAQFYLKTSSLELIILSVGALVVRLTILSVFIPEARVALGSSTSILTTLLGKKNAIAGKSTKKPTQKR